MKRSILLTFAVLLAATSSMAQSLEKMQWFNEPEQW